MEPGCNGREREREIYIYTCLYLFIYMEPKSNAPAMSGPWIFRSRPWSPDQGLSKLRGRRPPLSAFKSGFFIGHRLKILAPEVWFGGSSPETRFLSVTPCARSARRFRIPIQAPNQLVISILGASSGPILVECLQQLVSWFCGLKSRWG